MANFLDKIFGSKIEVDLVKMELEAKLCFHESRVDSYLARRIFEQGDTELTQDFVNYMQAVLQLTEDNETPVQQELNLLERYMQLYQRLLGDQLSFRLDVKCEADIALPPLILFPLISNALQQGYNSIERFPLKIKVRVFAHMLQMEVSNHVNHHIASQEQTLLIDYYKNRLLCLFPDRHHLLFNSNSHTFKANLQIAWSEKKDHS